MPAESQGGFFARLKDRLIKPQGGLATGLARLFGARKIDAEILEELETRLLQADVGVAVTTELLGG